MGSGNMTGALRLRKGTRGFSSESRCPVGTEAEGLGFIYISIYGSIYVYMYMCVCQIAEPLICMYVYIYMVNEKYYLIYHTSRGLGELLALSINPQERLSSCASAKCRGF